MHENTYIFCTACSEYHISKLDFNRNIIWLLASPDDINDDDIEYANNHRMNCGCND